MNRTILTLTLALTTVVAAQTGPGAGGAPRQPSAEQRARIAQMQPILDLAQNVRLLPELEKNKATAVTKAQAKQLLPILQALLKAVAVAPNDAKKYLTQIEDKILTDKQLTTLDSIQIKAEKERAAQRAQRQSGGQTGQARVPGLPGGIIGGQRPGAGQGTREQNGNQTGTPGQFNPFKQGPSADALRAYIALLQKK